LVKIYAALPPMNLEIERGFNCKKTIKTDLRNKLSVGRIQNPRMNGGYQRVEAR